MTIVTFKPKGGGNGGEPPHIDKATLVELLAVFIDISVYARREHDAVRRAELDAFADRLGEALAPFTNPPKGAA